MSASSLEIASLMCRTKKHRKSFLSFQPIILFLSFDLATSPYWSCSILFINSVGATKSFNLLFISRARKNIWRKWFYSIYGIWTYLYVRTMMPIKKKTVSDRMFIRTFVYFWTLFLSLIFIIAVYLPNLGTIIIQFLLIIIYSR